MSTPNSRIAYDAVNLAAGWIDRTGRVRLEVRGPDRAKFLHNLTTNDVKRLGAGRGCEAFVTSPQGKTLAYITLLALDGSILLRTETAARGTLDPHLRKYGVFDDIVLDDVSSTRFEIHVAGPRAEAWIAGAGGELPAALDLAHCSASVAGVDVLVIREAPTGRPGFTLIGPSAATPVLLGSLRAAEGTSGVMELDAATFEAVRIEAGTPAFGQDITPDNLPQEVGRDRQAINFVKGCYLGQETVARIDALGHVNRLLKGVRFGREELPAVGTELVSDGKPVGRLTSVAHSPGWGAAIGLAYVRTSHVQAGRELAVGDTSSGLRAAVSDLPMIRVSARV
jgi:folate-binding protein YgfZ